jgi:hypothetical protein
MIHLAISGFARIVCLRLELRSPFPSRIAYPTVHPSNDFMQSRYLDHHPNGVVSFSRRGDRAGSISVRRGTCIGQSICGQELASWTSAHPQHTSTFPGHDLTGRAPCYHCESPRRSSAWSSVSSFLRERARHPSGRKPRQLVPSRGPTGPRDRTCPKPYGARKLPKEGIKLHTASRRCARPASDCGFTGDPMKAMSRGFCATDAML